MRLWLLRPNKGLTEDPWEPWYDKTFGFVIRAATEGEARSIAANESSNETSNAWLNSAYSSCVVLETDGEAGIIIRDFARA